MIVNTERMAESEENGKLPDHLAHMFQGHVASVIQFLLTNSPLLAWATGGDRHEAVAVQQTARDPEVTARAHQRRRGACGG